MAVLKHNDRWRVVVHFGKLAAALPSPLTGKERLTKVVDTQRQAKALEREWEDLKASLSPDGEYTVNDWYAEFIELPRRATTRETYKYALAHFIAEHGTSPLNSWTPDKAKQDAATRPVGQTAVVRNLFEKASQKGKISTNPWREVKADTRGYKKTKEDFHANFPTAAKDQRELLDTLIDSALTIGGPERGIHLASKIAWAAWTGTRAGETRGLHREDIDYKAGTARIKRSLTRLGEEGPTKNGLHRTIIVVPNPRLIELLNASPPALHLSYRFVNVDKPWGVGSWQDWWDKVRIGAQLPGLRFHDLRHFCATQLLEMGLTPEDVAVQLGHTDGGALVRSVYGHPDREAALERIRVTSANAFAALPLHDRHTDNQETA